MIKLILERAGCTVDEAENGQIGFEKATASHYDIVLMDMQMPVLDGYKATAKLREHDYTKPVVALTANAMTGDQEKCAKAGCDGFLAKPVDIDKLLVTVNGYLAHIPMPPEDETKPQQETPAEESNPSDSADAFRALIGESLIEFQMNWNDGDESGIIEVAQRLQDAAARQNDQPICDALADLIQCCKSDDVAKSNQAMGRFLAVAKNSLSEKSELAGAPAGSAVEYRVLIQQRLIEFQNAWEQGDDSVMLQTAKEFQQESFQHGQVVIGNATTKLIEACLEKDEQQLNDAMGSFLNVAREEILKTQDAADVAQETGSSSQRDVDWIYSTLPTEEIEFAMIVKDFVPTIAKKLAEMKVCLDNSDFEELAGLAHWLKGAGGTCGFNEFYQPSLDLETTAKASKLQASIAQYEKLLALSKRIWVPENCQQSV